MDVSAWLIVSLAFLLVPVLTQPAIRRLLARLGELVGDWSRARAERAAEPDDEQHKLWLWSKRRGLCTALERVERLIATDAWMSGTRQLGNRLAYHQLVDELQRTPDVFPSSLDAPPIDLWSEPLHARRRRSRTPRIDEDVPEIDWSSAVSVGCTSYAGGSVEVLEIGRPPAHPSRVVRISRRSGVVRF